MSDETNRGASPLRLDPSHSTRRDPHPINMGRGAHDPCRNEPGTPDHVATSVFIGRLEKRLAGVCLLLQNAYSYCSARQRHRAGQSGEACSDNDAVVIHPLRGGGKRRFAKSDGSLPPLFAPRSA